MGQSQVALARSRAAGFAARMVCYLTATAASAIVLPVLLALLCLGAVLAAELLERRKLQAVLSTSVEPFSQPPPLTVHRSLLIAVLTTESTVAAAIGVVWFFASPTALTLPLALTAVALIGIANGNDRTAPSMLARQAPYLAVAGTMSVICLNRLPWPDATVTSVLPVALLAGVTVWVTRLRARASFARQAREAEREAERAKTATELQTKSQFIATVSHELRTSLNGVLGMAQTLLSTDLTARQRHQAEVIAESGRSLNTLLNDILDHSKLEVGKLSIEPRPEDLRQSIEHIAWLHGSVASEKGLEFRVEVSPGVPAQMMLDAVRVRQCLSNLVSNAIKFTEEGAIQINVSGEPCAPREDGTRCHLITAVVADTGIGIPPEQGAKLFLPYSQVDGTIARRFGGTGLGLSITRQLAEAMGGSVTFESEPGHGSVFRFSFKADAVAGANGAPADGTSPSLSDAKVLIADDIETNRVVMRLFLKPLGVNVSEVNDGSAAIEALATTDFDVALLDINMPGIDGAEVARRIREGVLARPNVALIAISADGTTRSTNVSLQGFDGVVTKPIDPRQLQETVAEALRSRRDSSGTDLSGT